MTARWPRKLPLLDGLRWRGSMIVEGPREGGFQVQWDAQSQTEWIYDRATLSAEQIRDWTGVDVRGEGSP